MIKQVVRWLNSLSRLVLGVGIIDLFRKADQSKLALLQAQAFVQKHQYMEALIIAEEIIDKWYPSKSDVERRFRDWVMSDQLKQLKRQLVTWEKQAQKEYDAALERSRWLTSQGRFAEAIALFEPVHQKFYQPEGKNFLNKLHQIIAAKTSFHLGLLAEQAENFPVAIDHYQNAITISPEWNNECRIRLAIVAIKTNNWQTSINQLAGINNRQANYIRGFAWAKLDDWEQANREWQSVSNLNLQVKSSEDKQQRDRSYAQREIQLLVDAENFEEAASASRKFLQTFGDDLLVQENLNHHILPRLEIATWENQNWEKIAQLTQLNWLDQLNITALHNWALATYYQATVNLNNLEDLIVAWSTALANLHQNPSLQNLPWLGDTPVDLNEVSSQLQQRLLSLISRLEQTNPEEYQRLHELYRLEVVALNLMGSPPSCGLRVKGLFLTPGCYQLYHEKLKLKLPAFPGEIWGALYTNWWRATLACLDGDSFKAKQIKPQTEPFSEAEKFAQKFVSYHEGCYYLEIKPGGYPLWREAIAPLKLAQAEIRNSSQWYWEIERLCELHYQAVSWNESDRLEFAQFWYDLLESPTARNYLEKS